MQILRLFKIHYNLLCNLKVANLLATFFLFKSILYYEKISDFSDAECVALYSIV